MKVKILIVLSSILPIILGGLIYVIGRPETLYIFQWVQSFGLKNEFRVLKVQFENYLIPEWGIYNLPDLLWIFAFTSFLLILWNRTINKENILYIITPIIIGLVLEFGQLFNFVNGTFDSMDILFYLIGAISSIFLISNLKTNHNEKEIATFR